MIVEKRRRRRAGMWKPCVGDTMTGTDWSSTGRREDSVANNGLDGLHSIRHLSEGKKRRKRALHVRNGKSSKVSWLVARRIPASRQDNDCRKALALVYREGHNWLHNWCKSILKGAL